MSDWEDTIDLIRSIRSVEIITKQRVTGQQTGVHISLFKGRGIEFTDIREYIPGDDIRAIDWKITARYGTPYVKEFTEDRDQTFYFVLDLSGSGSFGNTTTKYKAMIEVLASLIFASIRYHDRAGLILVTDRVEKFIPARVGRSHAIHLLNTAVKYSPVSKRSDLKPAFHELLTRLSRMTSIVLISDFFVPDCSKELSLLSQHHEVLAIRVTDPREAVLPDVGLIELEDAETGEQILIDTSDELLRERYHEIVANSEKDIERMMQRWGIPFVHIRNGDDIMAPLHRLFAMPTRGAI